MHHRAVCRPGPLLIERFGNTSGREAVPQGFMTHGFQGQPLGQSRSNGLLPDHVQGIGVSLRVNEKFRQQSADVVTRRFRLDGLAQDADSGVALTGIVQVPCVLNERL
jgi:hypothetical protein